MDNPSVPVNVIREGGRWDSRDSDKKLTILTVLFILGDSDSNLGNKSNHGPWK